MGQKYYIINSDFQVNELEVPKDAKNLNIEKEVLSFYEEDINPENGEFLGEFFRWGYLTKEIAEEARKKEIRIQILKHEKIIESLEKELFKE